MSFLATLVLSVAPSIGGGSSPVIVTLPAEARAAGNEILLGSVCEIQGASDALQSKLDEFSLGYAPSPGYSRLIFHYRIAESLERSFPGTSFRVTGERSVRVWPEVHAVDADLLRSEVELQLVRALEGRDVDFTWVGVPPEVEVPAGEGELRLDPRVPLAMLDAGTIEIPVDIYIGERRVKTLRTQIELVEWQWVPVLRHDVAPGQTLAAGDFSIERVERPRNPSRIPLTLGMVNGSLTSRALRAGQTVSDMDVHRPLAIHVGQQLSVEVRRGAVRARSMAVALDSGSMGERIRIELMNGGREMRGQIEARDLVVVDLGSN